MSIQSRLRNIKRHTPVSGRPRRFGKISGKGFTISLDAVYAYRLLHAGERGKKTGGAFGGVTKAKRREIFEARKAALVTSA